MPAKPGKRLQSKLPNSLSIRGELTIGQLDRFCDDVMAQLDANRELLRLDCRDLTYLDAAALQAVVALRNEAEQRGVKLVIENVSASILDDATLLGMAEVLATCPTEEVQRVETRPGG